MFKKKLTLFIPGFIFAALTFLFVSCLTLAPLADGSSASKWKKGEFQNEWGDNTGDYFMLYDGQFAGRYANTATNNGELIIRNIIISPKQGFQFDLTSFNGGGLIISISDVSIKVTLVVDGTQHEFEGEKDGDKTVLIPLSDKLLEILNAEPNIEYRITITNVNRGREFGTPSTFQSTFKLDGFANAYSSIILGQ